MLNKTLGFRNHAGSLFTTESIFLVPFIEIIFYHFLIQFSVKNQKCKERYGTIRLKLSFSTGRNSSAQPAAACSLTYLRQDSGSVIFMEVAVM